MIWVKKRNWSLATCRCWLRREIKNHDQNADKWYCVESFIASERRILLTHWIGDEYWKLLDTKWDSYRYRLFEKTGCLVTADGSDDNLIQPEGLKDYKVPPPVVIQPAVNIPANRNWTVRRWWGWKQLWSWHWRGGRKGDPRFWWSREYTKRYWTWREKPVWLYRR